MVHGSESFENISSILRSKTNIMILEILSTSRMYTREIAQILGKDEAEVSRRLSKLRRAGLIECGWERIEGKNVKICYSLVKSIRIEFTDKGIEVVINRTDDSTLKAVLDRKPHIRTVPVTRIFVGREKYLEELAKTDKRVIVVWGLPGIGKTYLVARYVSRIENPVYWYTATSLSNLRQFAIQIASFLESIGYDHLSLLLKTGWNPGLVVDSIIRGLEENGVVLVIDDYFKISDPDLLNAVNHIVDSIRRARLFVISRKRPRKLPYYRGIIHEVRLKGFSLEEVAQLAQARGLRLERDRIVELYLATQGVPALVSLYLDLCGLGRSVDISLFSRRDVVDFVVSEIFNAMNRNERIVFQTLSLLEEPAPMELLEYVSGSKSIGYAVKSLEDMALVEYIVGEGYVLHSLLKRASKELLGEAANSIIHKIGLYYLGRDTPLDFYRALMIYYRYRDAEGLKKVIRKRIVDDLDYHMYFLEKYHALLTEIYNWPQLDSGLKFLLEAELGHIELIMGDYSNAWSRISSLKELVEAEEHYRDEDLVIDFSILTDYSQLLINTGKNPEKIEGVFRLLEDLIRRIRDPRLREIAYFEYYGQLGLYYYGNGRPGEALKYYRKKLGLSRIINTPRYYVSTMTGLANILMAMGRYEEALKIMDELEEYLEEKYRHPSFMVFLYNVKSETLALMGRYEEAVRYAARSIEIAEKLGMKEKLMEIKSILAAIYYALGKRDEALAEALEPLKYYRSQMPGTCIHHVLEVMVYLLKTSLNLSPDRDVEEIRRIYEDSRECFPSLGFMGSLVREADRLFIHEERDE